MRLANIIKFFLKKLKAFSRGIVIKKLLFYYAHFTISVVNCIRYFLFDFPQEREFWISLVDYIDYFLIVIFRWIIANRWSNFFAKALSALLWAIINNKTLNFCFSRLDVFFKSLHVSRKSAFIEDKDEIDLHVYVFLLPSFWGYYLLFLPAFLVWMYTWFVIFVLPFVWFFYFKTEQWSFFFVMSWFMPFEFCNMIFLFSFFGSFAIGTFFALVVIYYVVKVFFK